MSDRIGHYMSTFTGKKFWPLDPRAVEVDIENIAHHLAMKCRWNGATRDFLSIAEHSVHVSLFEPEIDPLEKLLHDGAETYITDFIRPLKYDPEFRDPYKRLEVKNEIAIAERFGLQYPFPASVKRADEAVTAAEELQAINRDPNDEWDSSCLLDRTIVAPITIQFWPPMIAKRMFLARFKTLWTRREQELREAAAFHDIAMSA
jgi:uncharacterized protein